MLSMLARLVNPRKRRERPVSVAATSPSRNTIDDAERCLARSLASGLDEAVRHRQNHKTKALAEASLRIAHRHPHLTERLARLRLAQKNPDGALALIDASATRTSSLRLLRCACLILTGRRAEAHQELCEWRHRSAAPFDARLMLALLDWEAGDIESATATLAENLRQLQPGDERTLMAALCLAVERNCTDRAAALAEQLRQATARRTTTPDVDVLMATLHVASPAPVTQLTDPQLDAFVTELIAAEATIPAIVESLALRPDPALTNMLAEAIERALPDLSNESVAIESLARLRLLLGQRAQATALIRRGLAANPMSASLVLLQQSLEGDTPPNESIHTRQPHRSKAA